MDILSTGLTLLLIMDPLGNIPLFLSVLKTVDDESRKRQILIRELCFTLLVLLIFLFVGQYLLLWLNLSQEAVSIAGGIVLFLIFLRMIFPAEKGIMGDMPAGGTVFCSACGSFAGRTLNIGDAYFTCQISTRPNL